MGINRNSLEQIIGEKLTNISSVGGGCIANSQKIITESGKKFFLKQGFSNGMFSNEANGLKELDRAKAIKVPKVINVSQDYLILQYIEQGSRKTHFFEEFGQQLAQLHRFSSETFGFYEDNFIGSTPQPNVPTKEESNNWPRFYWNKRLMFQFRLAEENGYVDRQLQKLFSLLESKYEGIIAGSEEPPALLHGDLWSGNYMQDELGNPVIIDPAVYYGHREADLAMTKLFGGFPPSFYEHYNQAWPLKSGAFEREPLYLLYHVLNHMNIFGTGYYSQTVGFLKKLTR